MPHIVSGCDAKLSEEGLEPAIQAAALEAAYRLGRLDGELTRLREDELRIFGALLVARMIRTALEVEGHYFSLPRYQAWFAGVATLNDEPTSGLRSARSIALAVTAALARSGYSPVREAAEATSLIFAGVDNGEPSLEEASAQVDVASTLADAALMDRSGPEDILACIWTIAVEAAQTDLFATQDREVQAFDLGFRQVSIERDRVPSPRWALDLAVANVLAGLRAGAAALPCPGLFDTGLLRPGADVEQVRSRTVDALLRSTQRLMDCIREAGAIRRVVDRASAMTRSSSRLPALVELVATHGSLRSSQAERLLGMTDLGLRKTVDVGRKTELLAVGRLAGVRLISLRAAPERLAGAIA
jgi:hypothetical protein